MKFTKMQGIGNDYIYVNCFEETVENPEKVAKKISDRHFGVGSDGLVLIRMIRQIFECVCITLTEANPKCAGTLPAVSGNMFMNAD